MGTLSMGPLAGAQQLYQLDGLVYLEQVGRKLGKSQILITVPELIPASICGWWYCEGRLVGAQMNFS